MRATLTWENNTNALFSEWSEIKEKNNASEEVKAMNQQPLKATELLWVMLTVCAKSIKNRTIFIEL